MRNLSNKLFPKKRRYKIIRINFKNIPMNYFILSISVFLFSFNFGLYNNDTINMDETIVPPKNIRASDGSFPGKINIVWDKIGNKEGLIYLVYRGESAAIEDMELIKAPPSKKNYIVDRFQLVPEKRYYYRVRAGYDSQNISDFSEPDSGFIRNIALPPTDSLIVPVDSISIQRDSIKEK